MRSKSQRHGELQVGAAMMPEAGIAGFPVLQVVSAEQCAAADRRKDAAPAEPQRWAPAPPELNNASGG